MSCDAYQCVGFGLSGATLCFSEFAGIFEGMNSVSDDVTVRHLNTLESRYDCGALEKRSFLTFRLSSSTLLFY